jgi:heterodisulfide reductase subunit C
LSETEKPALRAVKVERVDPRFKYEVSRMPGAEKIALCFQCGTCTTDCPITRFSDFYRPRKIARLVQLGLKDRLLPNDALWLCVTCFTCVDHCPQGVEIASVVRALRNLSVEEEGRMPPLYGTLATNILKTGYVYVISGSRLKRRQKKGLPPLPKSNLEHVAKIFKATGFSNVIRNLKTTGG